MEKETTNEKASLGKGVIIFASLLGILIGYMIGVLMCDCPSLDNEQCSYMLKETCNAANLCADYVNEYCNDGGNITKLKCELLP